MRMERYPNNYPVNEFFPERRSLKGFEGGELFLAEKDGLYYLIADEGTMADFLMPDDNDLLNKLVTIYEFDNVEERDQYIKKRGWEN
jgi:hypothetical protein